MDGKMTFEEVMGRIEALDLERATLVDRLNSFRREAAELSGRRKAGGTPRPEVKASILRLAEEFPKRFFAVATMVSLIQGATVIAVRMAIYRLVREGKIRRTGRGVFTKA